MQLFQKISPVNPRFCSDYIRSGSFDSPDRYLRMPPIPGKPPVPAGLYPVNYNDLCTLFGPSYPLRLILRFNKNKTT